MGGTVVVVADILDMYIHIYIYVYTRFYLVFKYHLNPFDQMLYLVQVSQTSATRKILNM